VGGLRGWEIIRGNLKKINLKIWDEMTYRE
jgi:hypothetical protein